MRAESCRVNVDCVPSRRLDNLHTAGQKVLPKVSHAAQPVLRVRLLTDPIRHYADC